MKSKWIHSVILGSIASFIYLQADAAGDTQALATMPTTNQAKQSGEEFMVANKTKEGVVTLPSGLEYKVLEAGTGKKPSKNDTVTVDYEGTLLNGQVFDSSYQRGEPASFRVSEVISGWQEALQLMNTGSTWMLYIPPKLAYGSAGAGGLIGPNETLVFKVHLIGVK